MKVELISIMVKDPVEAFKFYTGKLGFVEKFYDPEHQIAIVVSPEDQNGTQVLLEPRGALNSDTYWEGIYEAGLPVIILSVDDVHTEFEKLVSRGVKFTKEPEINEWGTEAVFDDTCGNLIQIHQGVNG